MNYVHFKTTLEAGGRRGGGGGKGEGIPPEPSHAVFICTRSRRTTSATTTSTTPGPLAGIPGGARQSAEIDAPHPSDEAAIPAAPPPARGTRPNPRTPPGRGAAVPAWRPDPGCGPV